MGVKLCGKFIVRISHQPGLLLRLRLINIRHRRQIVKTHPPDFTDIFCAAAACRKIVGGHHLALIVHSLSARLINCAACARILSQISPINLTFCCILQIIGTRDIRVRLVLHLHQRETARADRLSFQCLQRVICLHFTGNHPIQIGIDLKNINGSYGFFSIAADLNAPAITAAAEI